MGRKDFNGQSLVENEKIEHKKITCGSYRETSICEQLVHLSKLVVYPDSWDINKLGEMLAVTLEGFKILISHYRK